MSRAVRAHTLYYDLDEGASHLHWQLVSEIKYAFPPSYSGISYPYLVARAVATELTIWLFDNKRLNVYVRPQSALSLNTGILEDVNSPQASRSTSPICQSHSGWRYAKNGTVFNIRVYTEHLVLHPGCCYETISWAKHIPKHRNASTELWSSSELSAHQIHIWSSSELKNIFTCIVMLAQCCGSRLSLPLIKPTSGLPPS
jgi:hypothetical protein